MDLRLVDNDRDTMAAALELEACAASGGLS